MMKGVAAKLMDINKVKERSNKAIKRYKHSERSECKGMPVNFNICKQSRRHC